MKKFFLSILVAVTVATSGFSADENQYFNKDAGNDAEKINVRILNSFNADFSDANNVQWFLRNNFARASFVIDNERIEAFYDLNGGMIGTSRAVTIDQMPTNVKREFAKRYSDYTVKETIEFDGVDESAYYISAENESKSIILKVTTAGAVSMFKAERKK